MSQSEVDLIIQDIQKLSSEDKLKVLSELRSNTPIHQIEVDWNASAEIILEAIWRAGALNQRAVKGMLAEASFRSNILSTLPHWKDITPPGDLPYDYLVSDSGGQVKVQTKNQRSEAGRPKIDTKKSFT